MSEMGVRQAAAEMAATVKPRLRGVLHQAAFMISLVTGTAIVITAEGARATAAATVYAVSVALLFGTSAVYHRGAWSPPVRAVLRRLDHSMIFVLIAGTYTPFALLALHGATRWVILGVVWGGALIGALARMLLPDRSRWLFTSLYLALGWVAIFILPSLFRGVGVGVVALMLLGGLFYTVGAVVYARQRPNPAPRWFGFHEVFHAFTLLAFIAHYAAASVVIHAA
jgi:hemolysin III